MKKSLLVAAGAALMASTAAQAEMRPVLISPVQVMGSGQTALIGSAAYELGREDTFGLEYDNIGIGPLGVRHGLGDGFEAGAYLQFDLNDADDAGAPDESGLRGITVYGKTTLNANVGVEFGITLVGADDIAPYPNDGLDFFVNVPMQRQIGANLLYGQFGYTIKDAEGFNANYFNYGLGYALPMNPSTSLNFELVGDEGLVSGTHMDLVFGVNAEMQPGMHLTPYASIGLYDASPDLAIGVKFEARI